MDITPIMNRELMTTSRKLRLWGSRWFFAGMMLAIVLATFAARYHWDVDLESPALMSRVAIQAFLWILMAHAFLIFNVASTRAAPSIAGEKDRGTLDFLLSTQLGNAEIVLGKLASCMAIFVAEVAAGLPVMLLLHLLGGVDLRLILLAYAGLITTAFFLIALAIWLSTGAPDRRQAGTSFVLWTMAWLVGPFVVAMVLPRFGIRLPGFLLTVNYWVMASSPLGLGMKIGGGVTPSAGLLEAVAWMCGLQIAGGILLVIGAIARLRSAYRRQVGGDSQTLAARLTRPGWRLRPRPPVGDDPILWREMTTSRAGLLGTMVGLVIILGIYGALASVTYVFGRPALIEVWDHGYSSGIAGAEPPDWNIFIRFFMSGFGVNPPVDAARTEFNVYLRFITVPLAFLVVLAAAGNVAEAIVSERARATWNSLIATPLSARDILRSKMRVALWRMRSILATLLVLWTIGLGAGAIHPIGYLASVLAMAAWTWFMLAFGLSIAIGAKDHAAPTLLNLGLLFLSTGVGALPFLLPSRWSSVLLGAGSPPFVAWLSLVSYRDVRNAWHFPVYPALQWMHLDTGEGPLWAVATCLIGIIAPAVGGLFLWRHALAHFDRRIGRPCRNTPATSRHSIVARRLTNTEIRNLESEIPAIRDPRRILPQAESAASASGPPRG